MPEDRTPHVEEIRWTPDPHRAADQVLRPETVQVVVDWCKGLQKAADARVVQLTQEEQTRRENKTLQQQIEEGIAKARKKEREEWKQRNRNQRRR